MKKLNRIGMLVAVIASCVAGSTARACDPPQMIRVTSVAAVTNPHDCEKVVLLRRLESLKTPVHSRVDICEDELAIANAAVTVTTADRDAAAGRVAKSMERVACAANLLESMCSKVCLDGEVYSKEQVAAALQTLIADHLTDKNILKLSEDALVQRQATAFQVAEKVAKWQRAQQELLQQVALLKAEHNVQTAQVASIRTGSAPASVSSPEKLLSELNQMLEKSGAANFSSTVVSSVPQQNDDTAKLLKEVDEVITGKPAMTTSAR